ncbi:MAG: crotonase/enoyl-CoA hydratase family protein [Silicimonas sp.]|nr:crotonase/enoyl-CoA hydratase family protein [Silicimonas sp.]
MTDLQTLALRVDADGVAWLTLNRPSRKNAMSAAMMDELRAFAEAAGGREDIRVVVLSGAEGTFCAGADLRWMQAQIDADRAGRMAEARRLALMLRALNDMPVPLIGRVEGVAMGGGMGLISVCDVAITAEDCRFGFTETRLGIIPATISPYVVARIGEAAARVLFMNARLFRGEEAHRLGLVARSVAAVDLDSAVEAEVAPFLALPKGAVGRAKSLARSLGARIDEHVINATIEQLADAWETDDAREGIAAFLEKRKPRWLAEKEE